MTSSFDPQTQRERQGEWTRQQLRTWQAAWHDAFDKDAILGTSDEFERPDPLPDDMDTDYRLIFGLPSASPDTLRACFALFPNGAEMQRRVEHYLNDAATPLTEAAAQDLVSELAQHVIQAEPNEEAGWDTIKVVRADTPSAQEMLGDACEVSYLFEPNLLEPVPDAQLAADAAQLFLTEPLYAAAGNWYQLRDWVTAAMFNAKRDKVYALTYQLWRGGWWLALRTDCVILTPRE